ncbi:MAG TPA: diguanylate cyclase, partial [Planctomycetaceae bacterium]|nr:diguanylate cyclase [Planctomycetaceae bacterium]
MSLHRSIGIDVLQACQVDPEVLEIVAQSHSDYRAADDGQRLGTELHLGARILAVADAYDSLSTDQVYRDALPHDEIMKVLMDAAGTQFDGNVVCALARWIERDGLPSDQNSPLHAKQRSGASGPSQLEDTLEASTLCHIFSYLYVLESLYDGFYLVDSDLRFVVWNRGVEKLLGHPAQEMLHQVWTSRILCYADKYGDPLPDFRLPMHQVIETGKAATTEVQIQHWDGTWIAVEMQSVPLLDAEGRLQGVAEIFRDMSRSHRQAKEYRDLKRRACRDALTGVANRGELETHLARLLNDLAQAHDPKPFSIIFVDVDHFKRINDTFGHAVGDTVLVEIAKLLENETYSGELVARYGGEEFVVLCPDTGLKDAVRRAERLRETIANTQIEAMGKERITAS